MRRSTAQLLAAALAVALLLPLAASAGAQAPEPETAKGVTQPIYTRRVAEDVRVETPYGSMFGRIIRPLTDDGQDVVAPVILGYSPYNVLNEPDIADDFYASYFVPRGYARAVFDVVGTRNSSGCYDYGGIRERETGRDIVNFLGTREWSNGKVGMIGGSYDGTTAIATAIEQPEHLAAIIPQVAIDRWYDYAYGGGIRYFLNSERPSDEGFDTPLAFDFGFGALPPSETDPGTALGVIGSRIDPCDRVEHTNRGYEEDPVYDDFWDERDYRARADRVKAAVLIEGGWLDHNVKHWDSTRFFMALPDDLPKHLVMGRWRHSSSKFPDAQDLRHAWFDRYLMGLDTGVEELPLVDTQLNPLEGPDGQSGERRQEVSWPPPGTREAAVRLTSAGTTGVDALALEVSDGSAPAPTRASYVDNNKTLTEEQMFAPGGSPINSFLRFVGEPLAADVRISGGPVLDLLVKSTAPETQYTPVLYDQAPDGSRRIITRGFLNALNRNGLDVSERLPFEEDYRAKVDFWDIDWVLPAGHRLGVVVASANAVWALSDVSESTNNLQLTENGIDGSVLRLPVSQGGPALGSPEPPPPSAEPTPVPTDSPPPTTDPNPDPNPDPEPAPEVERVEGEDRIDTAVEVSQIRGNAAETVVLARADVYPDALAGGPLAVNRQAPLLLTASNELSEETADEITRLDATRAVLLGGEEALSPEVADALQDRGLAVERIGGNNRFATAALVADALGSDAGSAFVVEGANADPKRGWPDAVSAAPLAGATGRPILLVTAGSVPDETAAALERGAVTESVVVGGEAAVGPAVFAELQARGHGPRRLSGDNRYATSAAVYDEALEEGLDQQVLWLATGADFPDALTAGATVGALRQSLLLVDPQDLDGSPAVREVLDAEPPVVELVRLLGGREAVSPEVEEEIRALVRE